MKVTFHCDTSFDELEINTILKAVTISSAIHDFKEYLRQKIKYADDNVSKEVLDEREEIREKFYECFEEILELTSG